MTTSAQTTPARDESDRAVVPPRDGHWGSYAVGVLADVRVGPEIVRYVEEVDATLAPFGGRFLVHGAAWEQVEGEASGGPVIIGFPAPDGAARWYRSAAYTRLVPLRADHSTSRVWLAEGVDAAHLSTDVLPAMLTTAAG